MFPLRDNVSRTHTPVVVWVIIALNVAVYLYEMQLDERSLQIFMMERGLVPARYFAPDWAERVGFATWDVSPFFSTMFIHGGLLHIVMNMWTLWIFGPALEDRLGPARFAILYVLSGIIASFTHAIFNATSIAPVVGASGAIAGVLAAYALRFPYAWIRVLVLIVIIPLFFSVPAFVFAGIWFLLQVLQGWSALLTPFAASNIAWWAHIGGFVAGSGLLLWLEQSNRPAVRYNGGPWER